MDRVSWLDDERHWDWTMNLKVQIIQAPIASLFYDIPLA